MATNSPANLRKPLRTTQALRSKSAYKLFEVSCLDLARLLDWCENSTMQAQSGETIRIRDTAWYREAYDSASIDFSQFITDHGGAI